VEKERIRSGKEDKWKDSLLGLLLAKEKGVVDAQVRLQYSLAISRRVKD